MGRVSSTVTLAWRVRIGTAGTTADPLVITFTTSGAGAANAHSRVKAMIACLTAGAAGAVVGNGQAQLASAVVGKATGVVADTVVNTTVALKVSVSVIQSVAQTYTTQVGVLRKIA